MAGRLSFSIAINLLTENFKRGSNFVKSSFRSMQMQFLTFAAALGAGGLGLSNFVSRLIDTARETNRVTTALKNVSGSMAQYASNQRWLLDMAKKYGIEVNALTGAYAKFTAAANVSGMSMADQRKIFESVSRATVAFGMSAEDSNGVFLALSQMMSKGKISSEELRLQMGERLPVALQAMAKAVGVSVAELDKLLKQGKLMSADVLPRFAEALNEMIPEVSTDNLETSINRLKNAFTEFAKNTGIGDFYKKLVDGITKLVEKATKDIRVLVTQLIAVLTGVVIGRFWKWVNQQWGMSERAARVALDKMAKAAGEKLTEVEWMAQKKSASMKMMFARSIAAIRAAFLTMLPTAVLTGIGMLVARIINVREEAKRIRSIFSDYKKEAAGIGIPEDADRLKRLYKIALDTNEAYNIRKNALGQINEMLGTSYSIDQKSLGINGDINTKIAERIKLLKDAAAVEFYQKQKLQAQSDAEAIIAKYGSAEGLNTAARVSSGARSTAWGAVAKQFNLNGINDAYNDALKVDAYKRIWEHADKQLSFFDKSILASPSNNAPSGLGTPEKDKALKKAEEVYIDTKKKYTNQLANGAIKEEEYNRLIDELNKETYKKLAGLLSEKEAGKNKVFQEAKKGKEDPLVSKVDGLRDEYWREMNELSGQRAVNLLSEEKYNKSLVELTEKYLKSASSIVGIDRAGLEFIEALQAKRDELLSRYVLPEEEKRDRTLDYRLKEPERVAAEKSSKERYLSALKADAGSDAEALIRDIKGAQFSLEDLKKKYNELAPVLVEELNRALYDVTSLDEALKIAEVREDVKRLSKEINSGLYAGVKDIAGSADRVMGAFRNVSEVFSDVDASGWERIMAVWNAITQTVDSFLSILEMIRNLTELTNQLAKAKEAEAAVDNQSSYQKIINNAKEAASTMSTDAVVTAANRREVAGNTAAAASGAAKSVAGIPFVGIALAAGAVASILALMASLPKFAGGGIVGGNSTTGDRLLARVNSGEMVLTKRQQYALYQIANGKGARAGGGGEVVFRIEGDMLVGVLNNHGRRQRRIK